MKKILALLLVAMMLVLALASCNLFESPPEHKCEHACEECGKCLDAECAECADK